MSKAIINIVLKVRNAKFAMPGPQLDGLDSLKLESI